MTDLHRLPLRGKKDSYHVVVESPRGATSKLSYNPELGVFLASKPLILGLRYPYDWGFLPGTRGEDDDPLDALVLWGVSSYPGVVIPCYPLALLKLSERTKKGARRRNDRLVMVPEPSARVQAVRGNAGLTEREQEELQTFFVAVTALTHKDVRVLGWDGPAAAEKLILDSVVDE